MKRNIIIPTLLLLTALPVSAQKLVISKSTVNVGRTAYQQPVTAVFECRNKSHRKLKIEALDASRKGGAKHDYTHQQQQGHYS